MKTYIATRLGPLAVETVGSGPPIMFWHGLFADGRSLRHQRDHYARTHSVIIVDGPGHGANLDAPPAFDLNDCAAAAGDILVATGSSRAVFVGLSWGAIVGTLLATSRRDLVSHLVLADAPLHAPTFVERRKADLAVAAFALLGGTRRFREKLIATLYSSSFLEAAPHEKSDAIDEFKFMSHRNMVPAIRAMMRDRPDCLSQAARLDIPILLMRGEADEIVTETMFSRYVAALPRAQNVVVPAAGHMAAYENPTAFNAAVDRLLARHAARSAHPTARAPLRNRTGLWSTFEERFDPCTT
jgi:pimeloyl-ACP methyl ester carboxylesterase